MGVRFNADDSRVASVGGKDWALVQFKVVPGDPSKWPAGSWVYPNSYLTS